MHASVRALLHQVIDYAGLFPPAQLPLADALNNYLRYRKESPYAWMLGRFVCPAARLPELLGLGKAHRDASLLSLTVLGTQSSHAGAVVPSIEADLRSIQSFRQAWGQSSVIDMYEVALPKGVPIEQISQIPTSGEKLRRANLRIFIEIPLSGSWTFDEEQLGDISVLRNVGVKLRCGGLTAQAFPQAEQVAFFIDTCRRAKMPWKATAGLHEPRRHWDHGLQVWHHGFLNLFGAGVLATTNPLTGSDIAGIVADEETQHFHFADDRMSWEQWWCSASQIADQREQTATSFGSCSFDEPVQGLLAMGLLDRA